MKKIIKNINIFGVPILILGLPLYLLRFDIIGIPLTLLEVIFWIVFVAWFIDNLQNIKNGLKNKIISKLKTNNSEFRKYPFSFFLVLFVLASFVGLVVSNFSNEALGVYKAYFIEAILFYILVFNYFKNKEKRENVFLSIFLSAFLISVYAIFQKITGSYWAGGVNELRVTSFFPYPNALGLYLGPVAVLSYFYFINSIKDGRPIFLKDRLKNAFVLLTLILSVYSIYLAKSEASLGAVLASVFLGSIFLSKRFALVIIVLGIVGGGIVVSNEKLRTFTLEKVQLKDFSGEVRKQQWRETGEALKNNFKYISGCGLSGYQACVEEYHQEGIFFNAERDPDFRRKIVIFDDKYKADHWRPVEIYMYPHNFLLNFWVELGLLGVIAVIGLLVQFFYYGIKNIQNSKFKIQNSGYLHSRVVIIGLMSVMVEIILHGTLDVPYFKNDLSFLFWLLFAMMGVYWVENERTK